MKWTVLLLSAVLLAGCAAEAPSGFMPIPNRTMTFSMPGVKFLPPQQGEWSFGRPPGSTLASAVMLVRKPTGSETTFILAEQKPTEGFSSRQDFLQAMTRDMNAGQSAATASRLSLDDRFGSYTVKFERKYPDPRLTGASTEDKGYAFVHPKNPKVVVTLLYSQRSLNQQSDARETWESFLRNVTLTDFSAD